jgi:hypothetical protein
VSLRAVILVALLLVSGCGAPAAPPGSGGAESTASDRRSDPVVSAGSPELTASTPSSAPTQRPAKRDDAATTQSPGSARSPGTLADEYTTRVSGGSLPVEYPLVFARVAVAVDRPGAAPPSVVRIEPTESMRLGATEYPEFYRLLGFRVADGRGRALTAAAYMATPERIVVNEALLDNATAAESTLAHESVHVIQFRTGAFERLAGTAATPRGSTADRLLRAPIIEGSATYVQGAYVRRYAPGASRPTDSLRARATNGSPAARLGVAPYLVGARYVDARVAGPDEVHEVYAAPPRTAEELLHDRPPGSEPVAPLTVRDAPGDNWTSDGRATDTYGELFVRVVLETGVGESTAADAAHGWGNDVRRQFTAAGSGESVRAGYAWAIRFDDDANATAFAAAIEAWREARPANASAVRLARATPETVVLFLGDERFVARATASGVDGAITVRVNEPE